MRRYSHLFLLFALSLAAFAQSPCRVSRLALFEQGIAEFTEQRTLNLQPGTNRVEWRSLMPQAVTWTIRAGGDGVHVTRQDVTYDGPQARNQPAPVLHLTLENSGAAGPRRVEVDYLAPNLSWKGDYALVLGPRAQGAPPAEATLEGWITVQNDTGADLCADRLAVVAGDVRLAFGAGVSASQLTSQVFTANAASAVPNNTAPLTAPTTGVSAFHLIELARDVEIGTNATISRFPLFPNQRVAIEERNVFENDARTQTLGRGGFALIPRSLEVRLVSRNTFAETLPAGVVTVYANQNSTTQVVGQDSIPLTPAGGGFSVSQGLSNELQATRRVVDRREVPDSSAPGHRKLVTMIEVVVSNHGAVESTAYVREGIENWGESDWTVTQSSHAQTKLGDREIELKLHVPAKGSVKVEYTVESR